MTNYFAHNCVLCLYHMCTSVQSTLVMRVSALYVFAYPLFQMDCNLRDLSRLNLHEPAAQ